MGARASGEGSWHEAEWAVGIGSRFPTPSCPFLLTIALPPDCAEVHAPFLPQGNGHPRSEAVGKREEHLTCCQNCYPHCF